MKHVNPQLRRFYEAYLLMAEQACYRPAAPSDGFGNIQKEENTDKFWIGCSDYKTNRAFVWSIEAARLLARGDADDKAILLLEMALEEVQRVRAACLRTKRGEHVS
jgi:hypothetical protein